MAEISTDFGRRVWWVDAFVGEGARGNPAVVVLLESELASSQCQQIAAELSVAETAFLRRGRDAWELRCFTPTVEVDLFGHASLAALHVLFGELQTTVADVVLSTRTIPFAGRREGRQLVIELPRHEVVEAHPEGIERALGPVEQAWTTEAGDVVALVDSFDALCALDPDTVELFLVPASLVIAVAEGGIDSDLAIRVFAPRLGVREDAATGRAMCAVAPIWHARTGEERLLARQVSTRGGVLAAALFDDRVEVMGRARTFLSGTLWA
jgi:predicted PhzF superfamily epimerase YddE/YHI9